MNKYIFFDIDGTIIDHFNKEIPKSTINALLNLQEKGHKIIIASGKGPRFIKSFLPKEIVIDTFIALNGNYVVLNDNLIFKQPLPEKSVKNFCDYCLDNKLPFVVSDDYQTSTLYKESNEIKDYYLNFSLPYPNTIELINDYSSYYQMSIMIHERDQDLENEIRKLFPELNFVRMSPYGLNVLYDNGLKEKGITQLLKYTNWDIDKTVAFGDGLNDIGMFNLVNTSVAMGNAYKKTKEEASLVTDHISENGIFNACKKLELF